MEIKYDYCKNPKTCKKCGGKFPNRALIDGKPLNLQARSYCLVCSPPGAYNHSRKQLSRYQEIDGKKCKECHKCHTWQTLNRFHMHKGYPGTLCKSCRSTNDYQRGMSLKQEAVRYKGGKCIDCGGVFPECAYDFHHLDPTQKDFGIMKNKYATITDIKDELDKCVLLCSNCHRGRHYDKANPNYIPKKNYRDKSSIRSLASPHSNDS